MTPADALEVVEWLLGVVLAVAVKLWDHRRER